MPEHFADSFLSQSPRLHTAPNWKSIVAVLVMLETDPVSIEVSIFRQRLDSAGRILELAHAFCRKARTLEASNFKGAIAPLGRSNFKPQHRLCDALLIRRSRVLNLCLCLLQLCLAQLNDGTQTNFVSRLREIEGEIALVDKLLSYIDPVERSNRVQPTGTNLVSDAVLEVTQLLLRGLRPQRSMFRSCRIEESVENRDVNVNPGGAVPACEGLYSVCRRSEWNFAHHAQCFYTRQQQISLCFLKMLCSPVLIVLRHNFRSVAVGLINQLVCGSWRRSQSRICLYQFKVLLIREPQD